MQILCKLIKRYNYTLHKLLPIVVMLTAAVFTVNPTTSVATSETTQYMFVQIAENVDVDAAARTIRLLNISQQTLNFTDRPVRMAGHVKMADYLKEWTAKAGKDNFGEDPPNTEKISLMKDCLRGVVDLFDSVRFRMIL